MSHQPGHAQPRRQIQPAAAAWPQPVTRPSAPVGQQAAPTTAPRLRVALTSAATFWYIVGNISFGAMYFAKVPAKKAFADAGMAEMTGAERFWYVVQCFAFGAGYFAKLPVAKALTELR
jgi:hypothetical protein